MNFLQNFLKLVRKTIALSLLWTVNIAVTAIAIVLLFLLLTLAILTKLAESISDEDTYNNWKNKWRDHVSNAGIRWKKN